jgi:hypothetical protein
MYKASHDFLYSMFRNLYGPSPELEKKLMSPPTPIRSETENIVPPPVLISIRWCSSRGRPLLPPASLFHTTSHHRRSCLHPLRSAPSLSLSLSTGAQIRRQHPILGHCALAVSSDELRLSFVSYILQYCWFTHADVHRFDTVAFHPYTYR